MKQIVYFLMILPAFVFAQDLLPTNATGDVVYSDVILVDSLNKEMLFDRCLAWCKFELLVPGDTIRLAERSSGKIAGKGFLRLKLPTAYADDASGIVNYDFTIQVLDREYQYTFSDMTWTYRNNIDKFESYTMGNEPYQVLRRKVINSHFKFPVSGVKFAPMNRTYATKDPVIKPHTKNDNFDISGTYLKHAGINLICGSLWWVTSATVATLSQIQYNNKMLKGTVPDKENAGDILKKNQYLSIGLGFLGAIQMIVGASQMIEAGKQLNYASKNKLTIRVMPDRVSLCYNLLYLKTYH